MQIAVRQWGGLGNQLFRYAAGVYFAERYDADLAMLVHRDEYSTKTGYQRPYQLSHLALPHPSRRERYFDRLLQSKRKRLSAISSIVRETIRREFVEEQTQFCFQPELDIKDTSSLVYIRGYWQSAEYVRRVESNLRSDLVFIDDLGPNDEKVKCAIWESECSASIHIRRGDYLRSDNVMPAISLGYYREAVSRLIDDFGKVSFFVFSDDIDYCRGVFGDKPDFVFVDHNKDETSYQDMRLMSLCDHHIIANSSFSWWGAWMNSSPSKCVYAPRYWLGRDRAELPELYPTNWRKLDN